MQIPKYEMRSFFYIEPPGIQIPTSCLFLCNRAGNRIKYFGHFMREISTVIGGTFDLSAKDDKYFLEIMNWTDRGNVLVLSLLVYKNRSRNNEI